MTQTRVTKGGKMRPPPPVPADHDYRKNPVMSCTAWQDNSYMIEDMAKLGYLRSRWSILDPTYGNGVWWKRWKPDDLVHHDLKPDKIDARDLPYPNDVFDAAVLDLPYMAAGGRETTTLVKMYEAFGMTGAPKTPSLLQLLINDSLTELTRVIQPASARRPDRGGIILVKCMDYVSSGKLWEGTTLTRNHAVDKLGLRVVDRFEHLGDPRPQPARKRADGKPVVQQHGRRNQSTLWVFQKLR